MVQETTSTGITYTTHSEQRDFNLLVEKYMLLDKKTLAELLALKELQGQQSIPYQPYAPQYPTYPTYPFITNDRSGICKDLSDCTNPFHDCINCPLRYTATYTVNCCKR